MAEGQVGSELGRREASNDRIGVIQKEPNEMQEYFSAFRLRLGRLMRARGLDIESPGIASVVATEILELAGAVAHTSERKFAPIASFAAGIAVGRLNAAGLLPSSDDVAEFLADLRKELEARESAP